MLRSHENEKAAASTTSPTAFETSSSLAAGDKSNSSKKRGRREAPDTSQARWKAANPWAVWCHSALNSAINRGLLERQPCRICGDPKTDGHHKNYRRPVDIDWLCRKHHKLVHRRELKPRKGGAA